MAGKSFPRESYLRSLKVGLLEDTAPAHSLAGGPRLQPLGPEVHEKRRVAIKLIDSESNRNVKAIEMTDQAERCSIVSVLSDVICFLKQQTVFGGQFVIRAEDQQVLLIKLKGVDALREMKCAVAWIANRLDEIKPNVAELQGIRQSRVLLNAEPD